MAYHRLNEHYRPALALARLLLTYLSPSGTRGPHPFLAFLVDMNILFERYVTVTLQGIATGSNLQVIAPDIHALDLDRHVMVKPDAVIYRGNQPGLALDAKYKCDDPNTDVYQALGYSHALGLPRAVLVYLASERIAAARHRIRPDANIEIILLPLDLSGDVADLRRQTRAFVDSVWREVVRT